MDNVFISVIITAYNRKKYLLDAIKSVVNQTLSKDNYEIIVIKNYNDKIIDEFIEKNNIKNILSDDNSFSGKIYEALKVVNGNIISFLDDDDLFAYNKLEYVYNLFTNNNLAYFHNNTWYIDSNGKKFKKIQRNNIAFNMSSISIKKSIINIDYLKIIKMSVDTFMYLCALESNKKIVNSNIKLNFYRIHNKNISNDLKFYKGLLEQLKIFSSMFNNSKERRYLKYLILGTNITIDLNENRLIQKKYFIYYFIFLFITLHKSLFILLIKSKFREILK